MKVVKGSKTCYHFTSHIKIISTILISIISALVGEECMVVSTKGILAGEVTFAEFGRGHISHQPRLLSWGPG